MKFELPELKPTLINDVGSAFPDVTKLYDHSTCDNGTFLGLEPFEDREARWHTYASLGYKQRFGLLVDTGAPESAAGMAFIQAYIEAHTQPC